MNQNPRPYSERVAGWSITRTENRRIEEASQMEAFERLESEGESSRAFEAYKLYRDLGAGRSLDAVAEQVYGEKARSSKRSLSRWSARFRWVERARARDDYVDSIKRNAIEDHQRELGQRLAERGQALQEKILEVRELAAEQALKMLKYPLTEEVVCREDENGDTTIILRPAGWNKNTARSMFAIASDDRLERKIRETARQLTEELADTPDGASDGDEPLGIGDLTPEERVMLMEELGMMGSEASGEASGDE